MSFDQVVEKLAQECVPFAQMHVPPRMKQNRILSLFREAHQLIDPNADSPFELVLFRRHRAEWELGAFHDSLMSLGQIAIPSMELRCPAEMLPVALWGTNGDPYSGQAGGFMEARDGWLWIQGVFTFSEWSSLRSQLEPIFELNGANDSLPSSLATAAAVISFEAVITARLAFTVDNHKQPEVQRKFVKSIAASLKGLSQGQAVGLKPGSASDFSGTWRWNKGELPLCTWDDKKLLSR